MSDYTSTATAVVNVNGEQAKSALKDLTQRASNLKNAIAKAASEGDKVSLKKWQQELKNTNREIRNMQSATQNVEMVMRNLDKATPTELRATLKTLNQQLNSMARGSKEWDSQVQKIKQVNAELNKVKTNLATQETFVGRIKNKFNEWGMSIAAIAASFTGLIFSARQAVDAYARMDTEEANVRKYTGMTAEQVKSLNEEFKNMDTRTSRENLNKLAQEAGRLGKQSSEDVMGFVRAADVINVALDDLGDGATLTISKLTNIFGDEKKLGTEKAMLAVGSVINVLSQNCTASAPYLAEFGQRLAGVGAQAGMTIPQIMAFGAVLDSQGQQVEASSTALSQLIMKMFKDPAKIAKAAGLDVKEFTATLKTSTNDALLVLLQRLKDLGGMDVLAPIFKDMGADGARASQVISALANKISDVKNQQEDANKAFSEATSASNEFFVQNNTVQAKLDKKMKAFNEELRSLGEKLFPFMDHAISGTTALMKVIVSTISFIAEYKWAIVSLSASIVAYTIAINASNIAFKAHYAWIVATKFVMQTMDRAVILVQMAFYALTGQISKAKSAYVAFNMLTKTTPWGAIVAGIVLIGAAITALVIKINGLNNIQKDAREIADKVNESTADQISKIALLRKIMNDENRSYEDKKKAIDELKKIIPGYNAQISDTGKIINETTLAVDNYIESLKRQAKTQAVMDKLTELNKEKLSLQEAASNASNNGFWSHLGNFLIAPITQKGPAEYDSKVAQFKIDEVDKRIDALIGDMPYESTPYAIKDPNQNKKKKKIKTLRPGGDDSTTQNKYASEDKWYESERTNAALSYIKGEVDYQTYKDKLDAIDRNYLIKKIKNEKNTQEEIKSLQNEYYKLIVSQSEALTKEKEKNKAEELDISKSTLEADNAQSQSEITNKYASGLINEKTYQQAKFQLEIEYLQRLKTLYSEKSKERADLEKQIETKLLEDKLKKRKESEDLQEKLRSQYFANNTVVSQKQLNEEYARSSEALSLIFGEELRACGNNEALKEQVRQKYEKARISLQKIYNQQGAADQMNSWQSTNRKFIDWMNTDGGQALYGSMQVITQGMGEIFSGLSSIVQAELEIQTSKIEKKYTAEVSAAEGNSYRIAQLEKKKEKEIAQAKNDANKKQFSMQVIQAVAQTAQNALSAYGSAASVPIVGYILAPIAAAMAVAAGAIQIASIKKQQQASIAQGYYSGGFTPIGGKYEEAGVVHKSEWVASKELIENPVARPIINMLDYAQRNNTIGSLRKSDISKSVLVGNSANGYTPEVEVVLHNNMLMISACSQSINNLNKRLNEPFITVNTVEGDKGIKKAQDDYNKLIKNKSPKTWT